MQRPMNHRIKPRKSLTWMRVAIALVAASGFAFFTFAPVIEQELHLGQVRAEGTGLVQLTESVNILCKNEIGKAQLNLTMEEVSRSRRAEIINVSKSLGCLEQLKTSWRAEYYLHAPDGAHTTASVIAQHDAAIEPAILALESERAEVLRRAERALTALAEQMSEDQRRRTVKRLSAADRSRAADALRVALGVEALGIHTPSIHAPPRPDDSSPKANDRPKAADRPKADDAADTPRLGEGLRLRLDTGLPGLQLQAPTMRVPRTPGGVLFRRDDAGARPDDPQREVP